MRSVVIILALIIGALFMTPSAAAEGYQCVAITEFTQTTDVDKLYNPAKGPPPVRKELERRWGVRKLGVIDPSGTNERTTMWVYPVCGYPTTQKQVWAFVNKKTQKVGLIMLGRV